MRKYNNKNITAHKQAGFTLIEVMVTMVIIGLLATVVVLNVLPVQDKAMVQKARTDISLLAQAVELYRLDSNRYPQKLTDLLGTKDSFSDATPRYIQFLPQDPWGREYLYAYPGTHYQYDVWSLGADGEEGGEGIDRDIVSWER